jgi:hypothetical protein
VTWEVEGQPPGVLRLLGWSPDPPPFSMFWSGLMSVELFDDRVIIRGEVPQSSRTIHLDIDNHEGAVPSNNGFSTGRFEQDALVVETRSFSPHRAALPPGVPSGSAKRLIERFEPREDGVSLLYSHCGM